jgi:hypothetical protein
LIGGGDLLVETAQVLVLLRLGEGEGTGLLELGAKQGWKCNGEKQEKNPYESGNPHEFSLPEGGLEAVSKRCY